MKKRLTDPATYLVINGLSKCLFELLRLLDDDSRLLLLGTRFTNVLDELEELFGDLTGTETRQPGRELLLELLERHAR